MKLLVAITTYNGPERVFAVWRSFQTFQPTTECKFLVVDDGSDGHHMPKTIEATAKSLGMSHINHKDNNGQPCNLGIPTAWNTACEFAQANNYSHALILNDDIEILPGAVDAATFFAEKNKDVATVGLTSVFPTPSGMIPDWPQSFGRNKPFISHYAKGCAFVIDILTWKKLGGFDTRFVSHFEDVDYGIRASQDGKVNVTIPQVMLHGWSKTFAANPHLQGHLRLEISRVLFKNKWGKPPSDFPTLTCMNDGRTYQYQDLSGVPRSGQLPFVKIGATQD